VAVAASAAAVLTAQLGLATAATGAPEPAPSARAVDGENLKPRVIVQTDISTPDNEPDDTQSLVHMLSLADQYEIEGIVATTGYALLGSYNVDSEVNGVTFQAAPKVGVLNDLPGGDRMEFSDNVATEGSTELGGNIAPFSRLSGEYETLLRSGYTNEGLSTSASSSRMSLRVRDLEPGRQYEVQFWVNDHRADVLGQEGNGLFTTIADGASTIRVQHNAAGVLGSTGHVVTGTFTAGDDPGRQKMISFTGGTDKPGDGSVADVAATVNAYQIRDVTDDPSVPDAAPGAPTVWSAEVIAGDEDVSLRGEGLRAVNFTRDYPQYRFVLPPEPQNIYRLIDAYEKDLPNLMKRSGQTGFLADESRQPVGYWPSADYLRERVTVGQRMRGFKEFGDGQSTAGSEQTIAVVDEDDDRPVWIHFWGSGNTFAQSVWDVQDRRSPAELKEFLSKVRLYAIGDQDCRNTPLEDGPCWDASTQYWLRTNFQDDMTYIWASNYRYYMTQMQENWSEYAPTIQASGNLGREYPNPVYGIEGDTPAFLHHLPGMNDPSDPTQSGYGGQFELRVGPDGTTTYRHDGDVAPANNLAVDLTFQDQLNDFVSRMEWADTGTGNRNPDVTLNGDTTYAPVTLQAAVGQDVTLSTAGTTDPEDDELSFQWMVDKAPGYAGDVAFDTDEAGQASFRVPADAQGQAIHVLVRVTDDGAPALSSWRRAIVEVTAGAPEPEVQVETRCLASRVSVAVRATNTSDVPMTITLGTPFGSKTVADVMPGKSAYQSFSSRASSVEAGTATVTASADGVDGASTVEAWYAAKSCG
jgi:hypothetical protein